MTTQQARGLKKIFAVCTVNAALLFVCCPLWAISPPQYSVWRQVNASIGASALVQISEMREIADGRYEFDIRSRCAAISAALAAVMVTEYNFGGIELKIHVLNPDGSPTTNPLAGRTASDADEIKGYFQKALAGNRLIYRVIDGGDNPLAFAFWVECKPKVIQYWNDNIGDYYGNDTFLAADVFKAVMHTSFATESGDIAVGFTTRPAGAFR